MSEEIEIVERSLGVALEIEERCSVFKLPKLMGQHYGQYWLLQKKPGSKRWTCLMHVTLESTGTKKHGAER